MRLNFRFSPADIRWSLPILIAQDVGKYIKLGETLDDSLGEAFDKVAKTLGLSYPGGPLIEELAKKGDGMRFKLPRAMIKRSGCDLSFSGIKQR